MTSLEIKKTYYQALAQTVVSNLNKNDFEAYYCDSAKLAVEKAIALIKKDSVCAWGGSFTIEETGLLEKVKQSFSVIDREKAKDSDERTLMMKQALTCDCFLTSFNAVSKDGIVVNIDGNGNRVAAITFGPKNVIALVGMNKIVDSQEDAIKRAENVAAKKNAIRFGKSPDDSASLCNIVQILRNGGKKRIKVILVGEEFGF